MELSRRGGLGVMALAGAGERRGEGGKEEGSRREGNEKRENRCKLGEASERAGEEEPMRLRKGKAGRETARKALAVRDKPSAHEVVKRGASGARGHGKAAGVRLENKTRRCQESRASSTMDGNGGRPARDSSNRVDNRPLLLLLFAQLPWSRKDVGRAQKSGESTCIHVEIEK